MSKLQFSGTYLIGVLYCWFGVLEGGVLAYLMFGYYGRDMGVGEWLADLTMFLGLIGIGVLICLNILGLMVQTMFLLGDRKYKEWLSIRNNPD